MASILQFFQRGLQKTKTSLVRFSGFVRERREKWTAETYEQLEAALIGTTSDMRSPTAWCRKSATGMNAA